MGKKSELAKLMGKKIIPVLILLFILVVVTSPRNFLSECTGHLKRNYHYHLKIEIKQDQKRIPIPPNIGINGKCIHPLHTHDSAGLVHIDHPKKIQVTLGDFFDTMGVVFSDYQLGSLKKFDGFIFELYINDKLIKSNYRSVNLSDKQKIKILIKSSRG